MGQLGKRLDSADRKDLKGLLMSEWDRQNIGFLIAFYERAFPGVINAVIKEASKDLLTSRQIRYAAKKQEIGWTRRLAIPSGLLQELKRAYPAIIVDKGQFEQFLRWFPQFDLWKKR